MSKKVKLIISVLVCIIAGIALGVGILITNTQNSENKEVQLEIDKVAVKIQYSDEQVPALVETEQGEVEEQEVPTIEEVDGGEIPTELEEMSDEEREKAGQGFAIDISTPWTVVKALEGQCIYLGNPYGSQCVNTANLIAENQVGYWFTTCGTGAARGMWDCADYNARGGYELITDPTLLRPGDILVTWGGEYGHTGMVIGYYNNGYVPVFSTNQGGTPCEGGGSAANTINLSTATFSGAFRWHGWDHLFEKPEPEPEPIPITGCKDWAVENGDTMSGIMLYCEGVIVYGEPMNQYADSWISQIYNPGKSVYFGWTHGTGYGLYGGDYLLHDVSK
jgi:hypothetical protein